MRDIKFRAWDIEGGFMLDGASLAQLSVWGYNTIGMSPKYATLKIGYHARPIELMQYTGLKDKNDIEIYEGDILKIGRSLIEEVKWINLGDWVGEKQPMVGFISHGTIYKEASVKVIGNIYENPELLKS